MDASAAHIGDEGVSESSLQSRPGSSSSPSLPPRVLASPTFAALRGSFPGLTSTPQSLFSRVTLLHNTSLFNTSSRSMHASNVERLALLRVMSEHLPALETRDTDSRTVQKRASVWEEITRKFNASTSVKRNRHQVQTLYKNMKAKAKKYQSRCLDPTNSVLERDHVSEMLLGMLNDEYQQRRSVMQQAAIMAFREDSSSADFKDQPIARDVSEFLKQEMHEASEVDSSAVLSPQASVCSPNSGHGDSSSSCGRGATSSCNDKSEPTPPDANKKLPPRDKNEEIDSLSEVKPPTEISIFKEDPFAIEDSPLRPESVRLQELSFAQYIAESQNANRKAMLNCRPGSDQSVNNELYDAQFPPVKKRKIYPENQKSSETASDNDRDKAMENNNSKMNIFAREKQPSSLLFPDFCCSSLHYEFLEMKQSEHKLKMQILEEELEAARERRREEKENRKIEHEMRLKFIQNESSVGRDESQNNAQSKEETLSEESKFNSAEEEKEERLVT